jgi:hypothetical protein
MYFRSDIRPTAAPLPNFSFRVYRTFVERRKPFCAHHHHLHARARRPRLGRGAFLRARRSGGSGTGSGRGGQVVAAPRLLLGRLGRGGVASQQRRERNAVERGPGVEVGVRAEAEHPPRRRQRPNALERVGPHRRQRSALEHLADLKGGRGKKRICLKT